MARKVTKKGNFIRERYEDPRKFDDYRTIKTDSHRIVFGRLKGRRWSRKGAKVQSILHPLNELESGPDQKFKVTNGVRRLGPAERKRIDRAYDQLERATRRRR